MHLRMLQAIGVPLSGPYGTFSTADLAQFYNTSGLPSALADKAVMNTQLPPSSRTWWPRSGHNANGLFHIAVVR